MTALDLKPVTPEQQLLIDRLSGIERKLESMPSDTEMAMAFSLLQAELRAGQKKLWLILIPSFLINFVFILLIFLRRYRNLALTRRLQPIRQPHLN